MTTGAESAGGLPERMRDYRVEAELRSSPDLHKLAQVFIGLAQARARREHRETAGQESAPEHPGGQGVE
ncbi:hypothetical protein [Nesterenkonia sp. PF2B19]|uniref:hypothetical protein n=1 Tax=Nesterenkonia sp. PF2B19 TaxID=1881858 RepID=UPI000871B73B|nr:hypothetical protein [Nesterenkonia sp. PF2B19]OSM44575.1 hypothetical protein BCY76_001345 [Nesterenkonia sp. PF2B19]